MPKHTPGPWYDNNVVPGAEGAIQITATHNGGWTLIADVYPNGAYPTNHDALIANARLIAAAPALLAACNALVSDLIAERAAIGLHTPNNVIRDALAAIRKATGADDHGDD